MKFLILPLLAAINYIDLNNPKWEVGPEVIYNVTVNIEADQSAAKTKELVNLLAINYTSQMKCQFKSSPVINCHFENSKMHIDDIEMDASDINDDIPNDIDNIPFAITFNESGIEELIVPSTIYLETLDKLRAIVNQLHTGIDLVKQPFGVYKHYDNFTSGICLTTFDMKLIDIHNQIKEDRRERHNMWNPGMALSIDKTRDMTNCPIYRPYFFENIEDSRTKRHMKIDVRSSDSKIIADHTKFISSTKTVVNLYKINDPIKSAFMQVRDNISVVYDSVVPAKKKCPKIINPISVEVMTGK